MPAKLNPAELLKLLADGTRLRILMLMLHEGELCVCELTHAIDEIQPKISRHLGALRRVEVVTVRRSGQWVYYTINPRLPDWALEILDATLKGIKKDSQFKTDLHKLRTMPCRPDKKTCA